MNRSSFISFATIGIPGCGLVLPPRTNWQGLASDVLLLEDEVATASQFWDTLRPFEY